MASSDKKAIMETEVSPVVSTSSDISSPEEDKCILTPLSLEFDPLSWKLEEKNQSNNSNTCSPEHSETAILNDSVVLTDKMTDSVQSFDLLTMDDIDTNIISEDKSQPILDLVEEFEPTLNTNSESISWPNDSNVQSNEENIENIENVDNTESDATTDLNSSISCNQNGYEKLSANSCQIASVSVSNTLSDDSTNETISLISSPIDQSDSSDATSLEPIAVNLSDMSSANIIATKLVSECVSGALHENLVLSKDQMLSSSSEASSLSEHVSSDSDESVQSVSSASSGSSRRKKKNTKKKTSMAAKPSVPHEQQITSVAKTNSIEANKKSVDNHVENHVDDHKTENTKPEMNGHTVNGDEIIVDMNYLPAINGYHKEINDINDIEPSLNGHSEHNDFDNDSLNESAVSPEPEYCVNVAKLCSTYITFDEIHKNNASKEVVITGISLKTLKSQYVNHVEHESQILKTFPKEIANTGIDIKSLKNSYVSTAQHNVVTKNAINKELLSTGVNINSIKSSLNTEQEMSEQVNADKTKAQSKLTQMECEYINGNDIFDSISYASFSNACSGVKDDCLCKVCSKHVYQMEKVKAEKSVFHKTCFRCKECNKQLNVDNYSSHEGQLYCTPHFKQLFQPKPNFDLEDPTQPKIDEVLRSCDLRDEKGRQRKYEMIIRENTPQELPPDVVRSNSKVDDDFDSLQLDLINIRNRFESGLQENQSTQLSVADKSSLQRSESIHARMQKYQSAVSGDKDNLSSDDEANNHRDSSEREKVVFSGMSSLKSQWEEGKISTNKEDQEEDTKEELAKLRQKLSVGRSESMRQVYERACRESNSEAPQTRPDAIVLDSSVKAVSIKEKFEKGNIDNETEEERVERLKKEREEEISVITEKDTASKEARNKFKQIDASVTKGPLSPTVQNANHTNGLPRTKITDACEPDSGDIVKSGEPVFNDVTIDSAQLQERFTYFENFKEPPKEPKRFQITPPRDAQEVVENNAELYRDPNVVRSCDVIEDIPKVDTAKKMLDKFKALENQKENQSGGPKPLKRITPPRDYTTDNDPNNHEPSPERDPNIIRSGLKNDDIQVEPEKARSLKAKFENWSAEIDRENKRNSGYDEDEDFVPHIDTTKNLRAKFEAIKDERKPAEKPKPRVNRFVNETGANALSDLCSVCGTRLYPMEKLEFSGIRIHKNCFRCIKCKTALRLDNFTTTADKLYCIPHYKQLFMEKGNYDEGFGLEQHNKKWTNKNINNNNIDSNANNQITSNKRNSSCDVNQNDAHLECSQDVSDNSDNDY